MKISTLSYLGNLRIESKHLKSGDTIISDAPVDNHGKGAAFSPTDLMSNSLAACALTVMGIKSNSIKKPIEKAEAHVHKTMASNPRRVSKIEVEIRVESLRYSVNEQELLRKTGIECPVALSLHPNLIQDMRIVFTD